MRKREKKELRSFLHRSVFWVISFDQAAVERLEHTSAKLWHTGPLIGQNCPEIEVNWQVDPRFASKRNLSGKKNNVSSEHSSGVAYHPYACNNCIFRIIYHSFKVARVISIKLPEAKSLPLHLLAMTLLQNTLFARYYTPPLFFSLKENWSDSVDSLRSLPGLILCWREKVEKLRSFVLQNLPEFINHDKTKE